ncbi:MAG TPA: von Willebrand factor type A domain-containing protein [Polyangiaceae bacterium]|nr:von Willebrand factor type A domain-containing protein [Polyangiaceae bacterium]
MSLLVMGAAACSEARPEERPGGAAFEESPTDSVRENCDDNPLLAECSSSLPEADVADSPAQSPSVNGSPGGGAALPVPPPANGDDFESPGTNPFVMVDHDPLSTFGVDVDTASYDVFRRDVEDGILPNPASVRLEEYVNYFAYAYPAADFGAEVPFSISLAAAPSAVDAGLTLLRVGIQGKAPPPAGEKRPTNLVFLVDVSGSMQESDKLPLAQQVLRQALDLLEPSDTVSIVSYAGDTEVRLEPTPVSDRDRIVTEISELVSNGGTNGASGINLAYEQAQAAYLQGGINHVVLCTDGDFNVGVSSTTDLVELIRDKRQTGITFTALGFGRGNLNDSMLEAISNAGNGFYGVISSEEQAAEYVDERLLSTLSLIARDMKVQVEFNPAQVAAYRLLGYENRAIADQDFRDDVVDAGEIGAGHRVTALYELVLAGGSLPEIAGAPEPTSGASYSGVREVATEDLVEVKVRYKDVDAAITDAALEVAQSLAPADVASNLDGADLDLQWASAVAAFSEVLKQSPYASSVDLDALGAIFEAQSERDSDRAEFYELFQAARGML